MVLLIKPHFVMINPLLLDERYDDLIVEGMMYQPINEEMKIKAYTGKKLEDSIYKLLEHIEKFNTHSEHIVKL